MKLLNIFNAFSITSCAFLPLTACAKSSIYANIRSSIYVGEILSENDILVIENGNPIPYDKTGQNGYMIDDPKYNIGYYFTEADLGSHKINVIYKSNVLPLIITVTPPKIVTPKFPITPYTKKSFKTPKVASTVYVVDVPDIEPYASCKNQWYVILESLEGILAQTEARLFVKHDVPQRNTWLNEAKNELGFETKDITPIEALTMFKDNVKDHKFVAYSGSDNSLNYATTIAGAEHYLVCDNGESFVQTIKNLGFEQGIDATTFESSQDVFEQYKDKLNNKMIINQKKDNIWLRDYAIASKSFTVYLDDEETEFKTDLLDWAADGGTVLGWTGTEIETVELLSQHKKVILPADNCANLSLFSGYEPKQNSYQVHKEKIIPEQGKHYVAIIMSDGDNIQWLQNDWWFSDWYGNKNRGLFPMNWTINPSILDTNPQIIDRLNTTRTENDYFVCAGSGYGYMNYSKWPEENRKEYTISASTYMKNNDMSVAYYLEPSDRSKANYTDAFDQTQLNGGILATGAMYAQGRGGVSWINDKPLVSCRESLWWGDDEKVQSCFNPTRMAERINGYPTDPTSINGYTIVNAHCWSSYGKMDGIAEMVSKLDSHVKVVTCEQIINMITENVPHTDVDHCEKYPEYYDQ